MAESSSEQKPESWWQSLWHKPKSRWWFGVPAGGVLMFVVGIIFWGGFNTVLEASNQEAFCISCHEMRDNVYKELQKTVHWANRTGVRATCSDCHVPRDWTHKMWRKFQATYKELPNKVLGTIGTREKFLAHRAELAEDVWKGMKATHSRECRNCHAIKSMDPEKQSKSARKKHNHMNAMEKGNTCIDCHKGIAHSKVHDQMDEEALAAAAEVPAG